MKDRLRDALKHSAADYAEVRVEFSEHASLAWRGREVESAASGSFCGGIARACTRGGWGIATFDALDDLPGAVRQACECAALVGRETTQLADAPPHETDCPAAMRRDFRGVGLDEKLRLIARYNEIVLGAHPAIQSSMVAYSDSFRTVHFASTRGTSYMEERPRLHCMISAVARDGKLVQRAYESVASCTDYGDVTGLEQTAREVAERAAALLAAPKCASGPQAVILNPRMAGVFVHEAFGHLSEADFLHENPKMRELMRVGRPIGVRGLNVVDDGSLPGLQGSQRFDDEGTPTRKTYLIREGVLAGHLHSLESAARMGAPPTGNARAIGRSSPPIVRMTNTYIENGDTPVDELFAGVERGVYACDAFGGQTQMEMFTFSAAYGYRIENGKRGDLVRDITLTGNVFETLNSIDGFADDLTLTQSGGGCGKGGQGPLPVSFGAPHVRLRHVVIG